MSDEKDRNTRPADEQILFQRDRSKRMLWFVPNDGLVDLHRIEPEDFTSGCTMEAKNFQRDLAKYEQASAVVLGVSVDTAQSHKDFCAKEGLNFKLLADPDAKVSTEYGSVMDYKGTTLAARNTFIVNPKGEIAKVYTGVKPADHSEQVLKDLAELKKS